MAQRAERQIQIVDISDSMPTGVIFLCWILCFHIASYANIAIFANFVCLWKTRINDLFSVPIQDSNHKWNFSGDGVFKNVQRVINLHGDWDIWQIKARSK